MKKYTRGFTLIELLVVIAIIGILSSVVLVSLNGVRGKANATALRSTMSSLRPAIAICNGSGTTLNGSTGGGGAVCTGESASVPVTPWGGGTIGAITAVGTAGAQYYNIVVSTHSVPACVATWHVDEASTTLGTAFQTPDVAGCK